MEARHIDARHIDARHIDADAAREAVLALAGPEEVALRAEQLESRQLWLPATHPSLQPHRLVGEDGGLVPLWLLRGPEGAQAVVEARTGRVLRADLPADVRRARVRLVLLLLLSLYAGWAASSLFALGGFLFQLAAALTLWVLPAWVAPVVGAGAALWLARGFSLSLDRLEVRLFTEPLVRAVRGRIRAPAGGGVHTLLRRAGLLTVCAAVAAVLEFSWLRGSGQSPSALLLVLSLLVALGVGVGALRLSRAQPGAGAEEEGPSSPPPMEDAWSGLIVTALLALRYVLTTHLFFLAVLHAGVLASLYQAFPDKQLPGPSVLEDALLKLAVIAAMVRGRRMKAGTRWPLAAGLLAGFVAEQFGGDPGKLGASLVVVTVTVKALTGLGLRAAFGQGLRFELGAALGRIAGRLVGGVLLGPVGTVLGEMLGEQWVGAAGLVASDVPAPAAKAEVEGEAEVRPIPRVYVCLGVLLVMGLVVGVALSRARVFGPSLEVPEGWVAFGDVERGFETRVPAAMERRELEWTLDSPYARWGQGPSRLRVVEHSVRSDSVRLVVLDGTLPRLASSLSPELLDTVLASALEDHFRLRHLQGTGQRLAELMGVSGDGRDVRCFLRVARLRFVLVCSEGPASQGTLAPGEAAFFAHTRVGDGEGALRELVDARRLRALAREDWPGYFGHVRQMRTVMALE
jgi:hypothetical protein